MSTIVDTLPQSQGGSVEAKVCLMGHKIRTERVARELGKARMSTVRKPAGFEKPAFFH